MTGHKTFIRKAGIEKACRGRRIRQAFERWLGDGRRTVANPAKQLGRRSGRFGEEQRWEEDALLL
jgi:hypothetical protein